MNCRLKCEKPGEIEYTITITAKAEEWEKLRDQMDSGGLIRSWPLSTLAHQIDDLLAQARKIYWPLVDNEGRSAGERAAHAQSQVR